MEAEKRDRAPFPAEAFSRAAEEMKGEGIGNNILDSALWSGVYGIGEERLSSIKQMAMHDEGVNEAACGM